jgi:hypothetical protein
MQIPNQKVKTMKNMKHQGLTHKSQTLGQGGLAGLLLVLALSTAPTQAAAEMTLFNLQWTNSANPKDTFSGTLKVDTDLFPKSGVINLATTPAKLTITVPQVGGATYSMADFSTFSIRVSPAAIAKLSTGLNLVSKNMVSQVVVYGKVGSPAHKNFNGCNNAFGICFNRDGVGPIYNLTAMTVSPAK